MCNLLKKRDRERETRCCYAGNALGFRLRMVMAPRHMQCNTAKAMPLPCGFGFLSARVTTLLALEMVIIFFFFL